jgi:hypothetical protein
MKSKLSARIVAEFLGTGFLVAAVLAGGIAATFLFRWLAQGFQSSADDIVLPHHGATAPEWTLSHHKNITR